MVETVAAAPGDPAHLIRTAHRLKTRRIETGPEDFRRSLANPLQVGLPCPVIERKHQQNPVLSRLGSFRRRLPLTVCGTNRNPDPCQENHQAR